MFNNVPDAPVTKFTLTMNGGKKGLLINSQNLCKGKKRAKAKTNFRGQNGKKLKNNKHAIKYSCPKKKKKKK